MLTYCIVVIGIKKDKLLHDVIPHQFLEPIGASLANKFG